MIRSYPLLAPVVLFIGLSPMNSFSDAAVISRDWRSPGDGLLTYDTVSRLEWLDLTESQLFKFQGNTLEERYQSVLAETAPGGMFEDFAVATRDDVFTLAESAGIDTTTLNVLVNGAPASNLIDLLGATLTTDLSKLSFALLDQVDSGRRVVGSVIHIQGTRGSPLSGLEFHFEVRSETAVWLHRQVPEPSSVLMIASGSSIFLWFRRRSP